MKILSPNRVLCSLIVGVLLSVIHPAVEFAPAQETSPASSWTESDSRLANHYIQLLQKDPSYGKVLDLLWQLYEKKEQTALLLDYFKGASESGPEVAKLLYAHLLRKSGEIQSALPLYEAIVEAEPDLLPALKALAEIADQQKRSETALALYTRLATLVPVTEEEGLTFRLRQAALHQQLGETDAAVDLWNALLREFPDRIALRSEILGHLLEAGATDSAERVLGELAQSSDPRERLNALLELNRLHDLTGKFDEGIAAAHEAMGLLHFKSPEYADLFSRIVRLHERFDRLEEFERELLAAADGENPTERSLFDLAEYYRLTADPLKEEEAVARLVALLPAEPAHRLRLADLQMRNDHYERAATTLDALLAEGGTPPLHLVLRRALVDLQSKGREAATKRLSDELAKGQRSGDGRREILDFARTHYLDGLVEQLLRDPSLIDRDNPNDASAPLELARFLHERGRSEQAIATLREFAEGGKIASLERASRFHQISGALKDLGLNHEALEALDEAIALAPENLDYQLARAELYIGEKDIDRAIAQLEQVREGRSELSERAEIDQRLFSLLRGFYSTQASIPPDELSVLKNGEIRSLSQYRRLAAAASQASNFGADEPPPAELLEYFSSIQDAANDKPSTERRYRAAWWAFKLQDFSECYQQLNLAKEESDQPNVEVEKMLLSLAEHNERTPLMVRHLTNLIEIDPEHADDYRQRRAVMRFELGFEDEAIRELKELVEKPSASLATVNALAKLYRRQGSPGRQIEVWERAYRKADLFEKRGIIRQLSNALIEANQPEEALRVQIDLLERENDPLQRRKQLDAQITVAQTHFLLDWMRDRYTELAQAHPFDRFYPEALARVHRAAGQDREAYEAMKKAYYMSGHNEELLGELSELSDELGDLKSSIYFRRQLLVHGTGDASLENWKELVRMLEKDLRVPEADELRLRLETKFGSDTDFLGELSDHYLKTGSPADAERTLSRLVALRSWDLEARFRLALLQSERGEDDKAYTTLSSILEETKTLDYPKGFGAKLLPLIRVKPDPTIPRGAAGNALDAFVFTVEGYPYTGGTLQDELSDALQLPRDEFSPSPKAPHLIRLRSIEEAAALAARLGQVPTWLAQMNTEERPLFERLWATRYAEAGSAFSALLEQYPDSGSHTDQLFLAYCHLLSGDAKRFLSWVSQENPASGTLHPRALYAAIATLILLKDESDDPLFHREMIYEVLAGLTIPETVANHFFGELRKAERFEETFRIGKIFAETSLTEKPTFFFQLSQVAGFAGLPEERKRWLERSLLNEDGITRRRLMSHTYVALTERLTLFDSDLERDDYLQHFIALPGDPPKNQGEAIELDLVFALAAKQTDQAIKTLGDLVTRYGRANQADQPDPEAIEREQTQNLQRLSRLLHFYAARLALDERSAEAFTDALSRAPLLNPIGRSVLARLEQFEIDRHLVLLERKNALEREAILRELRGQLREPDSRMELAKALISRGFHREAIAVYHDDAIRRERDYAPIQGLFEASAEALDPQPALEVIELMKQHEFPTPPGLTADYINEQHARFLMMDRNLERLRQLGQQPTVRASAPPITSRAHLPYQEVLVAAYRQIGDDDSLLELLNDLKERDSISDQQRLLGAEILAEHNRHEEAIAWSTELALDPSETGLQRRAMMLALESHTALGGKDAAALRALALASFERQPTAVTRKLARALHQAGAKTEGTSILQLLRRGTSDALQRTEISIDLLQLKRSEGLDWHKLRPELEALFEEFVYQVETPETRQERQTFSGGRPPRPVAPNAYRLVEWILASGDQAGLSQSLEGFTCPQSNRWLTDLLKAHLAGTLDKTLPLLLSDLALDSERYEQILETLPAFGESGITLARDTLEASGRSGIAFFPSQPERQIAFFHRLGDRNRLIEVHGDLVRETGSDFFHQSGLEDWLPSLDTRRRLPLLFAAIGEIDLAKSLFRAYDETLTTYEWSRLGFLNDYAGFLIEAGAYEDAEQLLKRILQKSLRVDLRLLPRLYAAWDRLDEWEARTRDLHLTRGQEVLLRDWITALAEGRELRQVKDTW